MRRLYAYAASKCALRKKARITSANTLENRPMCGFFRRFLPIFRAQVMQHKTAELLVKLTQFIKWRGTCEMWCFYQMWQVEDATEPDQIHGTRLRWLMESAYIDGVFSQFISRKCSKMQRDYIGASIYMRRNDVKARSCCCSWLMTNFFRGSDSSNPIVRK